MSDDIKTFVFDSLEDLDVPASGACKHSQKVDNKFLMA
jgi:hypothetical protein